MFAGLRPDTFHDAFLAWVAVAVVRLKVKQIAVDGTAPPGIPSGACPALQVVSAWATEAGLALAQVPAADQSNEIAAILVLPDLLDVRGPEHRRVGCQRRSHQIAREGHCCGRGEPFPAVRGHAPARPGRSEADYTPELALTLMSPGVVGITRPWSC